MAGFNSLDKLAARQQINALGGVPARVFKSDASPEINTVVLVDRDVEVLIDNGLAVTKRTVLTLVSADVGQLRSSAVVQIHPDDVDLSEQFVVADILGDDGTVVKVYARG